MRRLFAMILALLMLTQNCAARAEGVSEADQNQTYEVISNQLEKTVYHIVSFTADGEEVSTVFVADGETVETLPAAPEKEGQTFTGWYDGETVFTETTPVTGDLSLEAVYKAAAAPSKAKTKNVKFYLEDEGNYASVSIAGTCKKNQVPSMDRGNSLGGELNVIEAWTVSNIKNNTEVTLEAIVTALPEDGTLSAYTVVNGQPDTLLGEDIQIGDTFSFELAAKGPVGIAFVSIHSESEKEEITEIEGALYANDDLYITGKVPGNGIIEAIPVTVTIDDEEVIAAYDIKIYANQKQKEKGKTWQPAEKKVQVHFYDEGFDGELNVYHIDETKTEYIDTVTAENGWVSFEAESFSTYAVTKLIEKTVTIDGNTYKITVTYDKTAGIPEGSELAVTEVEGDEYLNQTAEALGWTEEDETFYTKFLDISIVHEGQEIEPATPVEVQVELLDVTDGGEALEVVHFTDGGVIKMESEAEADGTVTFVTESFSTFGFGSILRTLLSWTSEAATYTLQGFSTLLRPTFSTIEVTVEEGLEVLNAYNVQSTLGSLLNALYVKVSTALNLGSRESVVVYSVVDGQVGAVLAEEESNINESLSLKSADGFAVVRDTGYRRKIFDLGAVTLNGMMPKAAEAEATEAAETVETEIADLEGEVLAAFDIKIAEDGSEYQPDAEHPVDVSIDIGEAAEDPDKEIRVWHIKDDGTKEEITDFTVEDGKVCFTAANFSVYVVAGYVLETTIEASDGNTYQITMTFTESAMLPDDAQLSVEEMTGDLLADYLGRAAAMMEAGGFEYGRVFDISIVDQEGNRIQPEVPVQVSVTLLDAVENDEAFSVVHFAAKEDELEIPEAIEAETEGNAVLFSADHFSAYAIVKGPSQIPAGWTKLTTMDALTEAMSEGVYIGHTDGYYLSDTEGVATNNAHGIVKTKPAQSFPSSAAAKYYMEAAEGTTNQFYLYCLKDEIKYYIQNSSNEHIYLTTSEEERTAFIVTAESNGRFSLQSTTTNRYLNNWQDANGKVFACWTDKNNGSYFYLWHNDGNTGDPYALNGLTYGLMYWNDSIYGKAMMASSGGDNNLQAKELIVLSKKNNNTDQLFVPNDSEISMWSFEWIDGDYYYLKSTVNGSTKYLSIASNGALTISDTQTDNCRIQVIPGTGANDGKISLKANGKTLTYSGKLENGFKTGGTAGTEWLYFVESSELTSDYLMPYSATKVSVSDRSVSNGSKIVLYTRAWNDVNKKYEFYVVDHDGSLVRAYESGDDIEWLGGLLNTKLWNFVEYYWEGTNEPNDYYELYNQYSDKYLAPQITGNQLLSSGTIGINLNGRHDGYYQSTILAWDEENYAYAGLKVENGQLVTCPKSEAMDFYFAVVQDLPVDDQLTTVPTVDHTQYGITMRIKNFDTRAEMSSFLGNDKYTNGNTTANLLSTNLGDNGYPVAQGGSFADLFSGAQEVNHLFIASTYSGSGYYEYDSTQNYAHLDGSNFTVYKEIGTMDVSGNSKWYWHGQFMPFNDIEAGVYASVNKTNTTYATGANLPNEHPRKYERLYLVKNPDYYYGVEIEASFTQTPSGLDAWGHDIIYEFTGDDDFWLYVDGELIIDLGGIHDALPGSVNYSTGAVNVNGRSTTLRDLFESNYITRNPNASETDVAEYLAQYFEEGSTIFKDYSTHTMKIFYMERGAGAANLHMRFNLASVKPGTVELSKELKGIDQDVSVLAEYPYQIWYELPDDNEKHLLEPNSEDGITVRYKDTINDVSYHESITIPGTQLTYTNVFMIKPGETVVISLPDDAITYCIKECGVNTDVYQSVKVNSNEVIGSETTAENRKDYRIDYETSKNRPTVKYENTVAPEALRTLNITKELYKEDGETQLDYTKDATTFSLRLYLGTEFDTEPESANMYSYRIRDAEGKYCRWNVTSQRLESTRWTDTAGLTQAEKESITFDTSIFGSVAKIPAFYTVEIPNVLAGTTFRVQERPNEVPDGYSFQKYEYNEETFTDAMTGVQDVVVASQDPQVNVCNIRGWGLRINKAWSDADFMEKRDPTYFAVFTEDGEGNLTIVPNTASVQDENGNETAIIRQMKYGETTIYWYFPQLPVNDTVLGNYVIREVKLTNPTVEANGKVIAYDDPLVVLNGGDGLTLTGRQKSESVDREFGYIVVYKTGTVAEGSQVRVDTAGNNRPGVKLIKTDWAGNPLAGSTFTLTDSSGSLIGTFTSDDNGVITTAFLSNDGAEYTLTETKATQAYQGIPAAIRLAQNAGTVSVTGVEGAYYTLTQGTGTETTLKIKNRPYMLQAVKVDADTQAPLAEVTFALHRQVTVNGVTSFDLDPMTGYENLKTNNEGIVPKIDNTLPPGTYQLREKSTRTGYEILDSYIYFTVSLIGEITLGSHPNEVTLNSSVDDNSGMISYRMTIANSSGGLLTITKQVSGGFGDRTKEFSFSLSVPGKTNGDKVDVYVNGTKDESKALTITEGKVNFILKHDESITMKVPKNQRITITEENDIYTTTWKLDNETATTGNSKELILTADSILVVDNHLDPVAPTGVVLRVAPYAIMLIVGVVLAVVAVRSGKRKKRDEK